MIELSTLLAALRRMSIEDLRQDPKTGAVYAIGFDAAGMPFRAYEVDQALVDLPDGFSYAM